MPRFDFVAKWRGLFLLVLSEAEVITFDPLLISAKEERCTVDSKDTLVCLHQNKREQVSHR